jgi:hypothetical protein
MPFSVLFAFKAHNEPQRKQDFGEQIKNRGERFFVG